VACSSSMPRRWPLWLLLIRRRMIEG
jgi:hypothetical protein